MSKSALINEYVNLSRLIRAGERFGPAFEDDPESLRKMIKLEAKLERDLIKYFNGLVNERINTFIDWNEYRRRVVKAAIVDPMSDDKWKREGKIFKQAVYDSIYLGTLNGVSAGINIYSLPLAADDVIGIAQVSAKKHAAKLITQTNRNTRKMINRSVQTSLDLGETVEQASKRVNKIVKNPTRSTTIARTETVNSYGNGLLDFGKDAGATHKEWQAVLDSNTSPICEELDSQVVKIDATFESSFDSGIESPGAHVNCRSSMVLIFP